MGVPAATMAEAVFARFISAEKEERVAASKILSGPGPTYQGDRQAFLAAVHDALYCSKICSYAQGFSLMREAQKEYKWTLAFGEIAKIWRGGCIIRARSQKITEAYEREATLPSCCSTTFAVKSSAARPTGGTRWPRRRRTAFRRLRSHRLSRITTRIAPSGCLRTCCRRNGITSGRTPMSAWMGPRGKFFHLDWPDPNRPQFEA